MTDLWNKLCYERVRADNSSDLTHLHFLYLSNTCVFDHAHGHAQSLPFWIGIYRLQKLPNIIVLCSYFYNYGKIEKYWFIMSVCLDLKVQNHLVYQSHSKDNYRYILSVHLVCSHYYFSNNLCGLICAL